MPYIKEVCEYGNYIDVEKYYTWKWHDKNCIRGPNEKVTSEQQKKINERLAKKQKRRILNANFSVGDIWLTLTYMKSMRPCNMKEAVKNLKNKFLDKLRRILKKRGEELKYVAVTEIGKKGAVHHHLVIKKFDVNIISEFGLWKFGKASMVFIYSEDLQKLSDYMCKGSSGQTDDEGVEKKWSQSRNLIIPVSKKTVIKADSWTKLPKAIKGYELIEDSLQVGINGMGYPYQSYRMVKIQV